MATITIFKDLLAKGHKGEALVANLFQTLGYKVQDVSKDMSYFSKDIDLIATKGDEQLLLEVKADSRVAATGNVVIETIGNMAAAKKGWIYYTQATNICFVDMVNFIAYVVRTSELLELLRRGNCRKIIRYHCIKIFRCGTSELALVHLDELSKCQHYNKINIREIIR